MADRSAIGCDPRCGGVTPVCNAEGHCVGCASDGDCTIGHYCKIQGNTVATCAIGCLDDGRCGAATCCNMRCVDVTGDPGHCGGCQTACSAAHAQPRCLASMCSVGACDPGWADCNKDPKDGCEANLHADSSNCIACGMPCMASHAVVGCSDGCYVRGCDFGYDDCNKLFSDGCETPTLTDPANCGGCGKPCNALPNAMPNCAAGNCVIGACNPGFFDCDGDPMNGCEAQLTVDPSNCGACGAKCGMGMGCVGGKCVMGNPLTYSAAFVNAQTPGQQCTDWQAFTAQLTNGYSTVTVSGTFDMVGITCSDPIVVNAFAAALHNVTNYTGMCNGHLWTTCNRFMDELWLDPPVLCDNGNCPDPGYLIRPCIGNPNWGGVNSATCTTNKSQTMTLKFL